MKQQAPNLPKIQHYVPQFILRSFCFNKNEQIYIFDKKTEKEFRANIENVAAENGFYNFKENDNEYTIDHNFSDLETTVSSIFEKIRKQESLAGITKEEKRKLSAFIAAQFARTKHLRLIAKQINEVTIHQVREMGIDPKNVIGLKPLNKEDIDKISILQIKDCIVETAPVFNARDWILFKSTESMEYYISDNPITLYNQINPGAQGQLGLAVKGIEVYFPMSPKLSIVILDKTNVEQLKKNYKDIANIKHIDLISQGVNEETIRKIKNTMHGLEKGMAIESEKEDVLLQNALQVIFSTRFIYSSRKKFDLVRKILRNHPEYKGAPLMYGTQ